MRILLLVAAESICILILIVLQKTSKSGFELSPIRIYISWFLTSKPLNKTENSIQYAPADKGSKRH